MNDLKEKSKISKVDWLKYTQSIWEIEGERDRKGHPSPFPVEIPYRLIRMYSFVGDTVLDPFAGIGSTSWAAKLCGRNSIGIDCDKKYIKVCKERIKAPVLKETFLGESTTHKVFLGDSRDLKQIPDSSIDLIVTSPPYWNQVQYNDSDERNLGNINDYNKFLKEISKVWGECYRVLKINGRMCLNTADVYRKIKQNIGGKDKEMVMRLSLHSDFKQQLKSLNFTEIGEIIWLKRRFGRIKGPIFGSYPYPPTFLLVEMHEYITIYRKCMRRLTYDNL